MDYKILSKQKALRKFSVGLIAGISFLLNPLYLNANQNDYFASIAKNHSKNAAIEVSNNESQVNEGTTETTNATEYLNNESTTKSVSYTDYADITNNLQLTRVSTSNTENKNLLGFVPENIEKIILQGYIDFKHRPIQITRNISISFDSRHCLSEHRFNAIFRIDTPVRFYSRANIATQIDEFNPDFRYTLGALLNINNVSLTAEYQENHIAERDSDRRFKLEARLRY